MILIFSKQLLSVVKYFSNTPLIQSLHMSAPASTKVALVLAGSGVYDGSEIHEASACLVHLSRAGADVSMYAPNVDQMHVIDHTKGQEMEEKRNVLVESARIARGNINDLANIKAESYDAIVFPGGFGAAKNLCNWAVENANCTVNDQVKSTIEKFHSLKKPIGLCCIAPVLAAKCIPGVEITVGHTEEEGGKWPYAGTAAALEKCGAKHVVKDVSSSHVDVSNKVVTTPAYMCNAPVHQIFDGVGTMILEVLKLAKN